MRVVLPAPSGEGRRGTTGDNAGPGLCAPDTRARVVGYLATAPVVAPGWRTDGAFVWPSALAAAARDHGQAPPAELFGHMRRSWFLLPAVVPPELRTDAASQAVEAGRSITVGRAGGAGIADGVDQRHDARLARDREAEPPYGGVRPARLFDAAGPDGTGWFTPRRLRIPEAARRARLASYLGRGRLVLRCAGRAPDPLDSQYRLALGWRTDGVWVWPEALAHYVLTRGIAPELELLCHIERHGYVLPDVDDGVARSAAVVARRRPSPLRPPPVRYLRHRDGRLARVWEPVPSGSTRETAAEFEVLRDDLRWGPPPALPGAVADDPGFRRVHEAEAVAVLDSRWARADAVPALD